MLQSFLEALDCLCSSQKRNAFESQIFQHGRQCEQVEVVIVHNQHLHLAQRTTLLMRFVSLFNNLGLAHFITQRLIERVLQVVFIEGYSELRLEFLLIYQLVGLKYLSLEFLLQHLAEVRVANVAVAFQLFEVAGLIRLLFEGLFDCVLVH